MELWLKKDKAINCNDFGIDGVKNLFELTVNKKSSLKRLLSKLGWKGLRMSSRFVADLKRLADLKRKMGEMDELGKLLKK